MSAVMKVYAPGKLILSGEHAVVYGNPAIAMAVNRYVTTTVTEAPTANIAFDLSDIAHRSVLTLDALSRIKNKIKRKYQKFIHGEYRIGEVLQKPFELAQFALSMLTESFQFTLPRGMKLTVQSDIPMGAGMGSSAATILSVMVAITTYLKVSISHETLFQLALQVENMQHGHSSGLDLRVVLQGGCLYWHDTTLETRGIPPFPMYLIQTGIPESSTGECVEAVAPHFQSPALLHHFAEVTHQMDSAMQQQDVSLARHAISENHRLLHSIGVVPDKVSQLISEIELTGGAAKICGAGSVRGERGGVLLAMSEDVSALSSLVARFGYSLSPIISESRGVHVV